MISTQLLAMASGLILGSASAPNWQSDYSSALAQAMTQHKPVAVLINAGEAGKQLPPAAVAALANNFVCVYADVATPAGRELANSFQLAEGLVISDRDAHVQALRYAGKVTGETVTKYAEQYAAPVAVTQTDYAGTTPAPAVVPASASVVTSAPVIVTTTPVVQSAPIMAAPVLQSAPLMQAAPVYQTFPGVIRTGGCPNGNCGR